MGSLGLVLAAIALEGSPGLAQNVEQEKLVFEHVIRTSKERASLLSS